MVRKLLGLVFVVGSGTLSTGEPLSGQEDFRWAERMTRGQILEVQGITGEIRAVLATGEEAQVVARKRGDRGDFQEVAIEVAEAGDRIVICAVYGSWKHGQDRCNPDRSWRDDEDRRHRNRSLDVEVEYEVRVPAGVRFEGAMVAGGIEAEGLRSEVSATTVSGPVRVSTTGRAWATSVSGDLELRMGEAGQEDMDFHTVSGDITLWLPSDFSAEVAFNSLSGDFDSDFDLAVRSRSGRWIGLNLKGTIGQGGPELSINTVSGDVRLRRGQD